MSFLDSIMSLFGKKPQVVADPKKSVANGGSTVSRPKNRQVYEGRQVPTPEWAEGKSISELVAEIPKHVVCKYMPKFEQKKIMSTQVGKDGNLVPEYVGVAGDCGALKQHGRKVAEQNGMTAPFRYVDQNVAFRMCCDNPRKCPFYLHAEGEMDAVNSHRR